MAVSDWVCIVIGAFLQLQLALPMGDMIDCVAVVLKTTKASNRVGVVQGLNQASGARDPLGRNGKAPVPF
jgi:hypothetical protein